MTHIYILTYEKGKSDVSEEKNVVRKSILFCFDYEKVSSFTFTWT
jgi:hypothetical protein